MQCVWFNDEARFLNVQDTALLSDFDNITYDDLRDWITLGLQHQQEARSFICTASDSGIPSGSSVYDYEAIQKLMCASLGYNESVSKLDDL
ncbi:hypothetical protein NW759_011262 [Fusarium solani]|uniref:Uncharacterized protein n=1 Tax=Fusarium solani TaxID=169388 RepID=A0A9P9K998_FUSSL|nr:uncharacterized protein B0J15DRAFT_549700 [Fusarium solani]KAH7252958.1 hypothetical protein B0J15DRAFT_549700 [Fusarium solani]KAJ4213001.1 hypothetical protein NW759_011262 [Fusarium solani]